jgi:aminoglycoside phosphotransferase (APT) family kinase protein
VTPVPDTTSATVVRPILAAAFPDLAAGRPKLLLAGRAFDTWAVGDTVVRFPKDADQAARLETERAVHPLLAERMGGLVPVIRAASEPVTGYPFPVVAFERPVGRQGQTLDGPILQPKPWGRTALARELGTALSSLHATPIKHAKAAGVRPWGSKIDSGVEVGEGAIAWASRVAGDAVDTFLVDPIPVESRELGKAVLCHGGLKGERLFVSEDGTRLTAVVDWCDVTLADPALDLAGLAIWLGPAFVRDALATYTGPADDGTYDRAIFLARAGLLDYLDRHLEGTAEAPIPVLDAQLRAVFGS